MDDTSQSSQLQNTVCKKLAVTDMTYHILSKTLMTSKLVLDNNTVVLLYRLENQVDKGWNQSQ